MPERRIVVLTPGRSIADIRYSEWALLTRVAEVTPIRPPDLQADAQLAELLAFAAETAKQADLIITECGGGFVWRALFRAAGSHVPFALIPHYNHVDVPDNFRLLLASLYRTADDILFAGSRSAAVAFGNYGMRSDCLFPFGFDDGLFNASRPRGNARAQLGVSLERPLLFYAGRLHPDKKIHELIEVFAKIRAEVEATLLICYRGHDPDVLVDCKAVGDSIGDVVFLESPAPSMLADAYRDATLYLSTAVSVYETFGRSPLEAMHSGTPPVVARFDGFRDTVTEDAGVLVDTLSEKGLREPDVDAFASASLALLRDPERLARLGANGPRRAIAFGHVVSMDRFCSILVEVIDRRAGARAHEAPPRRLDLSSCPKPVAAYWERAQGMQCEEALVLAISGNVTDLACSEKHERMLSLWFEAY
jgi:glycosyltransferase involved in cell wall biosynthesis